VGTLCSEGFKGDLLYSLTVFVDRKRAIHYNLHVLIAPHTKFCEDENSEEKSHCESMR
jgi:hypothetical protein